MAGNSKTYRPSLPEDAPTLDRHLADTVYRHALGEGDDGSTELEHLQELLETEPAQRLVPQGVVAEGGMGVIELALDHALERRLAMKLLKADFMAKPEAVSSFVREARITGQLDHPAIVPVHELGIDSDKRLYFTMKIVEGCTFSSYVKNRTSSPLAGQDLLDVLEVVIKVCDALAFAHDRGVVHCDVKPLNVMVGEYGQVYLMDWGLAQYRSDRVDDLGASKGLVRGTPSFMAPEQSVGDPVTVATDIFATGALLYFALTGHAPYEADSTHQTLDLARQARFEPIDSLRPEDAGVPPGLLQIVEKAMALRPDDRYSSALELRSELSRFLRGGGAFPEHRVQAGEHILREGDVAKEAYFLTEGLARAYRTIDGNDQTLGLMEPGEVIGEMALLTSDRRTASVVAVEDCTMMVVTEEVLEREMSGMQAWMAALTRTLARRFRERETSTGARPW